MIVLTYPMFTSSHEFFSAISLKYSSMEPEGENLMPEDIEEWEQSVLKPTRKHLVDLICIWVKVAPEDFRHSDILLSRFALHCS